MSTAVQKLPLPAQCRALTLRLRRHSDGTSILCQCAADRSSDAIPIISRKVSKRFFAPTAQALQAHSAIEAGSAASVSAILPDDFDTSMEGTASTGGRAILDALSDLLAGRISVGRKGEIRRARAAELQSYCEGAFQQGIKTASGLSAQRHGAVSRVLGR